MAIYTTFFVCSGDKLPGAFPTWRLPLPKPVKRKVKDWLTGQTTTIETRRPEWPEERATDQGERNYGVVAIKGAYEDYLAARLPAFVRRQPHLCSKELMNIELDELGAVFEVKPGVEDALYSPPSAGGAHIWQVRPELVEALAALDEKSTKAAAKRWAERMSAPEHTQNADGERICEGWDAADALGILKPLAELARKATKGRAMYLLMEP